eukprot:357337-Chlamydomonas_euryale.AAC.4
MRVCYITRSSASASRADPAGSSRPNPTKKTARCRNREREVMLNSHPRVICLMLHVPNVTSRLAGWGWYGVAQDRAQGRALCDSALPAA